MPEDTKDFIQFMLMVFAAGFIVAGAVFVITNIFSATGSDFLRC